MYSICIEVCISKELNPQLLVLHTHTHTNKVGLSDFIMTAKALIPTIVSRSSKNMHIKQTEHACRVKRGCAYRASCVTDGRTNL